MFQASVVCCARLKFEENNYKSTTTMEEIKIKREAYVKRIKELEQEESAKELMRGFATNPHNMLVDAKIGTLAEWSVSGADALIAELRKGGAE